MKQYLEKNKLYILGYILYFSIVLVLNIQVDEYVYPPRTIVNIKPLIVYSITIPLIIYFIIYAIRYLNSNRHNPIKKEDVKESITQTKIDNEIDEGSDLVRLKRNNITGETKQEFVYTSFSGAWRFTDFVIKNGPKLEMATHRNDRTNEEYKTIEVINNDGISISIRFHSTLGELTTSQIKERKNELFVGKKKDNGLYYLLDNNYREWIERFI